MGINFDDFIGMPLTTAKVNLEKQGFIVQVLKSSKPKIKTDSELVIVVKQIGDKQVLLVVGDFLINIGDNDGLV